MTELTLTTDSVSRRARVRFATRWTIIAAAYAAVAIWLTWPQVAHLSGLTAAHHDSLFSVWRLTWIAHALRSSPAHLFDANIFFPQPRTLAYSDAILLPGVVLTPLLWLGCSPLVVYNLAMLSAFVLCALGGAALGWRLTRRYDAAFLAGLVFAFAPYRFDHFAHFELQLNWWLPLALIAADAAIARGGWRSWAALGGLLTGQILCCIYYALLFVPFAALHAGIRLWRIRPRLARLRGAVWLALPVLVLVIYSHPYRLNRSVVGERSWGQVRSYSADWADFARVEPQNIVWRPVLDGGTGERFLFPTVTVLLLAGAAALTRGSKRQDAVLYAVLLVVAVDLTRGAHGLLFPILYWYVPGFSGLRVPARAGALMLLALSALAALGWAAVAPRMRPAIRRTACALLCAAFVIESMPRLQFRKVEPVSAVHDFVSAQPNRLVLELPVSVRNRLDRTLDATYMYESIGRWYPLVNGYSGFYPPSYLRMLTALRTFPQPDARAYIARLGVTHVILHEEGWFGRYSFGWTVERLVEAGWTPVAFDGLPGRTHVVFAVK